MNYASHLTPALIHSTVNVLFSETSPKFRSNSTRSKLFLCLFFSFPQNLIQTHFPKTPHYQVKTYRYHRFGSCGRQFQGTSSLADRWNLRHLPSRGHWPARNLLPSPHPHPVSWPVPDTTQDAVPPARRLQQW